MLIDDLIDLQVKFAHLRPKLVTLLNELFLFDIQALLLFSLSYYFRVLFFLFLFIFLHCLLFFLFLLIILLLNK
jgi:hypothetical protein